MTEVISWQEQVGSQRDWIWRGWQIRYTYQRCQSVSPVASAPLILLHGFGASIGHWRKNIQALSQHHTVYAIDLLGFGASEKAIAPYNVNLWAELVHDFWQTFIRQPMILIGNSIGSLIGLITVAEYPNICEKLIMMSLPDPGVQAEFIPSYLVPIVETMEDIIASPLLLKPLFYLVRRRNVIGKWVKIAYTDENAITEELVDILATPPQDRHADRAFCSLLRSVGSPTLGPSVKKILPKINIPMLLIWGLEDRMVPRQFAHPEKFLAYNSHLELIQLEGVGHCPHDECPEKINNLILQWIQDKY